jgi:hypothetical protein
MNRKRIFLALLLAAGTITAGAWALDQDQATATLTGCLRSGSSPDVLLLRGATSPSAGEAPDQSQMPRDYLLVSTPDGVDLGSLLNHRVEATGQVSDARSGPTPPDGANAAERALRRLGATAMREVAANCS